MSAAQFKSALALGVLLLGTASVPPAAMQSAPLCSYLPGSPVLRPTPDGKECHGLYWSRDGKTQFEHLREFGAIAILQRHDTSALAQAAVTKIQSSLSGRPIALGDLAFEYTGNPSASDAPPPSEQERRVGKLTAPESIGLLGTSLPDASSTYFSCGDISIRVDANPTKLAAARQLAADIEQVLKSANQCSQRPAPAATARPTPSASPTPTPGAAFRIAFAGCSTFPTTAVCRAELVNVPANAFLVYRWTVDGRPHSGTGAVIEFPLTPGPHVVTVQALDTQSQPPKSTGVYETRFSS